MPLSLKSQTWPRLSQIVTNHPAELTERTSCVSGIGYPVSDTHDNLRTGAGLTFCTGMPESGAARCRPYAHKLSGIGSRVERTRMIITDRISQGSSRISFLHWSLYHGLNG
jgi:hypothetical protein